MVTSIGMEKERLKITLYSIGDGVITTNNNGYVTSLNQAAVEITGWKETEAQGKSFADIIRLRSEETGYEVDNPIQIVLKSGKIVGLANHTVLIRKDGRPVPIADSAAPIRDDSGQTFGVVMVFRDVRHGIQLLLYGIDLPAKLYAVFLVDVLGKQFFLLPCEVRYPAQIVKDDGDQILFSDMMG